MIETLKKIFNSRERHFWFVYLFGSRARENYSGSSDLDIAVFLNPEIKQDYFDIKLELCLELSRALKLNDIDIVIMNQCQNVILLNNIIVHGKLIYQKDKSARIDYEQRILHNAIDFKHQRKMTMGF